jgi:hypothetical protein
VAAVEWAAEHIKDRAAIRNGGSAARQLIARGRGAVLRLAGDADTDHVARAVAA